MLGEIDCKRSIQLVFKRIVTEQRSEDWRIFFVKEESKRKCHIDLIRLKFVLYTID